MRRRLARLALALTLVAGQLLLFAGFAAAADISSAGPLTHVIITPDLNCQVAHVEDQAYEFFSPGDEAGSCGTFLYVGGTSGGALFGPQSMPSGGFPLPVTPWTPVAQSTVTGSGTASDPLRIVTTVDATGTGLRVEQTDTYVLGTQQYRTDIQITNGGPVTQTGALYRVGDCYLQENDEGYGRVDDGSPACVAAASSTSRIEQWTPLTVGSHYMEDYYGYVYYAVNGQQLPDTCVCTYGVDDAVDNGAGLSWPVSVGAGQQVTFSHETYFSPRGRAPVTTSFTQSVPDPTQISLDPVTVATSVAVTAGVVLLVPFPSALFNSTLEENYDEVMAGVGRISRRLRAWWLAFVAWLRSKLARPAPAADAATTATVAADNASATAETPVQPAAVEAPVSPAAATDPIHPLGGPLPGQPALAGPSLAPRATALVEPSVPGAPMPTSAPTQEQVAHDVWRTPLGILGFVVLSAILYAFLDPTFGFSLTSLATVLGLAIGLLVILVAYGTPLVFFSRSHKIGLDVRALPATLAIAVICVLVSRLTGFQPGYLYGLIIGFYFARHVTSEIEGKAEAAAAGSSLVAAFVAWILLAFLRGSGPTDEFTSSLLQAAIVTVVVAGLENAVFAMLPLRFMPGGAVFEWNRIVWGVLMGLGILGFAHVLLNPTSGYMADTTRTSFFTMIVLLLGFGLASVLFWAWFRFRPDRNRTEGQGL